MGKEIGEEEVIQPQGNIWLPAKQGEELKGKIKKVIEGQFGSNYVLELDDKTEIVMPSHRYLMPRLAMCSIGDTIKVRYDGELPPKVRGQNPMKTYTVTRLKKQP